VPGKDSDFSFIRLPDTTPTLPGWATVTPKKANILMNSKRRFKPMV
jgi:hypothetical protein